ncbi:MAG TPA: response regulator, partial [Allocoleopsis sp.]
PKKPRTKVEKTLPKTSQILVVEDIIINQKIILKQLERLGYKADCVGNGQEALDILSNQQYNVILMDCQMPILDGYETTEILRKLEGENRHIIIGLTAYAMEGDRGKCLAAGMDDYLTKPLNINDLSNMLKKWL